MSLVCNCRGAPSLEFILHSLHSGQALDGKKKVCFPPDLFLIHLKPFPQRLQVKIKWNFHMDFVHISPLNHWVLTSPCFKIEQSSFPSSFCCISLVLYHITPTGQASRDRCITFYVASMFSAAALLFSPSTCQVKRLYRHKHSDSNAGMSYWLATPSICPLGKNICHMSCDSFGEHWYNSRVAVANKVAVLGGYEQM